MNLEILNSPEFQKDFIATIQRINDEYNLSIQCGQICYGDDLLKLYINEEDASS